MKPITPHQLKSSNTELFHSLIFILFTFQQGPVRRELHLERGDDWMRGREREGGAPLPAQVPRRGGSPRGRAHQPR